jgi:protoporphyrinogen oxidase
VVENCGVNVYENFFAPLLRGKFGGDVEEISAAWLVGRIRFRSHRSMRGERLGYMEGGFQTLIDALAQRLKRSCDFYLQQPVKKIRRDPDGLFTIATSKEELRAKTVVTTQAPKTLLEIFDWPPAEAAPLKNLRFQKTICATVALQRSLTATYWCNISNPQINFAVLLEHTNLYRHPHYPPALLYLANYCGDATDPLWQCSDEEVSRRYLKSLQDYFGLDRQDVLWIKIARAENSGLIYTRGTLNNMPKINSSTPGLFNIGMLRSFPERSINDSVLQGEQAAQAVLTFLQRSK